MIERTFDLAAFCARVEATAKECNAVRQDLVRGLKDYYEAAYGYDRYGAETIFMLPERMSEPYVFGFGGRRILHDRRISPRVKAATAELAVDMVSYGADGGLPYAFFSFLAFLARHGRLATGDLRYGLVVSAGESAPFRGLEKSEYGGFFLHLLGDMDMPAEERAFWAHSLIARHGEAPGAGHLITLLLGADQISAEIRTELCWAWLRFRQPRLNVVVPPSDGSFRGEFVAEHMPFWVAHAPSWPSPHMVRLAIVWLPRLGADPLGLVQQYVGYSDTFADGVRTAVAEVIAEHHASMPRPQVKAIIEKGLAVSGSSPVRRKFYGLGTELFGAEYLDRAGEDTASSVRQWAARQKHDRV